MTYTSTLLQDTIWKR